VLVPLLPSVSFKITFNNHIAYALHGYINSIKPFRSCNENMLELAGVDGFFGSRATIGAVFNAHVDGLTHDWWAL